MWKNQARWRKNGGTEEDLPEAPADRAVTSAAVIVWEEHCVECAMPECYSTCPLYVPRRDQKCARFEYGIYPNRGVRGLHDFGADVTFRRWAKLEAQFPARPRLASRAALTRVAFRERWLERVGNVLSTMFEPISPKRRFNGLITYLRARTMRRRTSDPTAVPDALLVKFYSPSPVPGQLIVEAHQDQLAFRESIPFAQGWNERTIPFADLRLDPAKNVRLLVSPANDQVVRLVFTWLDLVVFGDRTLSSPPSVERPRLVQVAPASKVKCVVWDLDNTLWSGVIGDAGPEGVRVNENALALIRALDERGIIQSVASKNDHELAWAKVESLGLADYLLHPAIHWGPKSQSVLSIANELNIGVDTFALIDDSAFERGEVATALPQVRVYDATEISELLTRNEFDVRITEMSRRRRLSYLEDAKRKRVAAVWGDDYDGFLRSCGMTMRVGTPRPEQASRCLELIQRTNQLNLSSRRYDEAEFARLLADDRFECFAFDCEDRFGQYGLVGFASIERGGPVPVIRDFVLSCRVAQKRVEEAFIAWYGRRAAERGNERLRIALVPTERNRPMRAALERLPLKQVEGSANEEIFEMSLATSDPIQDVVRVEAA